MEKSLKVMFIVPYISRDLDGCALVGYILKKKYGIESVFVNGYSTKQKIFKYQPDAIIWDHLAWDFKVKDLIFANSCGIKTFCLPTEGFFIIPKDGIKATGEYHGSEPYLDIFFTWGEFVKDAIIDYNALPESKIKTTGCCRFDFYDYKSYPNFYLTREEFCKNIGISNVEAPIILWAPTSVQIGRHMKTRLRLYTTRGDNSVTEIEQLFEDGETEYEHHGALIKKLAKQHPDWNFIIKIHPAAKVEPYLIFKENNKNIFLGFNAHIRNFLKHSEVLIQRNCTTSSEAWMLNIPTIQLEITKYHFEGSESFLKGSKVCYSSDDVEKYLVDLILNKKTVLPPEVIKYREDYIKKFYFQIDGKASERVASIIQSTLNQDVDHAIVQSNIKKAEVSYTEDQNQVIWNRLKDLLGINRNISLRLWKKIKKEGKSTISDGEREATESEIEILFKKFAQNEFINK